MKFPKGKGFDLSGGLVLTIVLDDGFTLTGRFLGETERKHSDFSNYPSSHKVDNEAEFLLLQLTESVITSCKFREVLFPEGSVIAINVEQILFIGPGINCKNDDHKKGHNKKDYDCDCDCDHDNTENDYENDHNNDDDYGCDCDHENDRDKNK